MNAFFSGVDNNDEKADRFFGVIGNVNNFFPELKFRVIAGGKPIEIDVKDIFDINGEMYHAETFPKEWENNIKESKVTIVRSSRSGGVGFNNDDNKSLWEGSDWEEYLHTFHNDLIGNSNPCDETKKDEEKNDDIVITHNESEFKKSTQNNLYDHKNWRGKRF
jgi:hypothetical protein